MITLPFTNLAQLKIAEEHLILADLRWDLEYVLPDLKPLGFWWLHPIGRTYARDVIAARVSPHMAIEDSPIELVSPSFQNIATQSTSAAELLPTLLFETSGNGDTCASLAKLSEKGWRELERLHNALGGGASLWATTRRLPPIPELAKPAQGIPFRSRKRSHRPST